MTPLIIKHTITTTSIESLRQKAKKYNQKCYIIGGGGKSVNDIPFDKIKDQFLWSLNASSQLLWTKDLPIKMVSATDIDFARLHHDVLLELLKRNIPMSLSPLLLRWLCERDLLAQFKHNEIYFSDNIRERFAQPILSPTEFYQWAKTQNDIILPSDAEARYSDSSSKFETKVGFSKNIDLGFFESTIAHVALQLAYVAGFKEVYLIGIDMKDFGHHFYEDKERFSHLILDFNLSIMPNFKVVGEFCKKSDFKVYNCSEISTIPESIFPKVKL